MALWLYPVCALVLWTLHRFLALKRNAKADALKRFGGVVFGHRGCRINGVGAFVLFALCWC